MKLIHVDMDSGISVIAATAAGFGSFVTNAMPWPVLGPFISVMLAALCGSLLGMSISEPVKPRSRMFKMFAVNGVLGIVSVYIWPHIPMLGWTGNIAQPAVALMTAFLLQWLLLPSIEAAKRFINSFKAGGDK